MNSFESITPKKQKNENQKKKWECNHKKEEGNARLTFKITGNFEYCVKCAFAFAAEIVQRNSSLLATDVLEHWNSDYKCNRTTYCLDDCPVIVALGRATYMKVYEPENNKNPHNIYYELSWNHLRYIAEPCNAKPLPRIEEVPLGKISLKFEIELLRAAERIRWQKKRVWFPLLCYVVLNRIYLEESNSYLNALLNFYYFIDYFWTPFVGHSYTKWKDWATDFLKFCLNHKTYEVDLFENPSAKEFPELCLIKSTDDLHILKNFGKDHFYEWFNRYNIHKVLLTILCAHKYDSESDFFWLKLRVDMLKKIISMARLFYFDG